MGALACLEAGLLRRALAAPLRALANRLSPISPTHNVDTSDAKLVADHSFDVIVRFDRAWKRTYVSPAVTDVLGFTPEQYKLVGWRDGVHPDQFASLEAAVQKLEAGAPSATATYQRFRPDGRLVWLESTFRPLPNGAGFVAVLRDVTARKIADEQVYYLAHHDALTGLANRRAFGLLLDEQIRECTRSGESFALLALDLDRFKDVNDGLGHDMGDLLLKEVALRLCSVVREVDHVARLGGDEFAVLASRPMTPTAGALLAGRIVEALAKPFGVGGQALSIGVSIGVAVGVQDGETAVALMKAADLALYRAKSEGKGTFRFFEAGMDAQMQSRRKLELELRQAVQRDEFEVFYQPLLDIASSRVRGFEALVRWNHPERGIVLPDQFIPLAEQTGLIVDIGERVLNIATAQVASWGSDVTIAVNLSAVQFADGRLAAIVADALARSGLPAERLELEITESVLLHDDAGTLSSLHELRNMGVRIAMDDFGTGYSSLRYLQSFPFDKIKIDRSFVRNMLVSNESAAIVAAVLGIGQRLGIQMTAEGVETEDQLSYLQAAGCDIAQGYLVGRPEESINAVRFIPACSDDAEPEASAIAYSGFARGGLRLPVLVDPAGLHP